MKQFETGACATILLALAAIHVYWARGGDAFRGAAVPSRPAGGAALFDPGPASTLAVAGGLTAAALAILRAGFIGQGRGISRLIALVFLVRAVGDFRYVGFSKRVRGTEFARNDDRLYSPLCLTVSLLAWGSAR